MGTTITLGSWAHQEQEHHQRPGDFLVEPEAGQVCVCPFQTVTKSPQAHIGDQDKTKTTLSPPCKKRAGIRLHLEVMMGMSKTTLREGD